MAGLPLIFMPITLAKSLMDQNWLKPVIDRIAIVGWVIGPTANNLQIVSLGEVRIVGKANVKACPT